MGETLLFYGGRVLTMEEKEKEGGRGSEDAVLVKDGLIQAVGFKEELEPAARGARRIDLKGNLLMPSFLDSHSHFTQVAYSFFQVSLDGSPQGRTAWMKTPYIGTENSGYGILRDDQVTAAFEKAAGEKVQLLAHCNGDAAASFFVAHVYHWGDVHIRNFGYERASAISPLASALKADLPFTLHQDSPVIQPDMWETVWCAANRVTREGVLLGPEEKIPVWQALRAVTYLAAWQYGEEARKGAIAPGKRADLLVADADPLTVPSDQLRDIRVLQTYKDGRCVYCL